MRINTNSIVNSTRAAALQNTVPPYRDTRAPDAVERVLTAILDSAASFLSSTARVQTTIADAAEAAGRAASVTNVARYIIPFDTPTLDYDAFVQSQRFIGSAAIAAAAAASGAVSEKLASSLYTATSLKNAAKQEAINALRDVYGAAARTVRTELPMMGAFGPGQGDPRFRWDIKQNHLGALGPAALTATNELPADHPTNPFRHRRHPSNAVGFDIERRIRLDFDGSATNALQRAGYGVDRVTGTYREEIMGLHKPLGPQPETNPIGLIVEGTFELNRISLVDNYNHALLTTRQKTQKSVFIDRFGGFDTRWTFVSFRI